MTGKTVGYGKSGTALPAWTDQIDPDRLNMTLSDQDR